jgi:xanthine dehydrogenase accessory factor
VPPASHDAILETALDWHRAGKGVVLATVVDTWGSAPRPVGALLAVSDTGEMAGSVSGGCVEGAVVAEAFEALKTGASKLLTYGVSDDDAFAVGLACGGTIRVQVQPVGAGIPGDILAELVAARAERRPIAYVVDTETWARRTTGPEEFPDRFRADRSGFEPDGKTFVIVHNPPLRMAVIGAVHIAQPLMQMARLAGYDATLIDPRDAFGAQARFPGETIVNDWPDEALQAFGLDARTAVITLTHDPKLDDPAIRLALRSEVFYLGCLGSTRTHAKRVARLVEAGFTEAEIARIHAPLGLAIGAKSPAEIAISILAQVTERLRTG